MLDFNVMYNVGKVKYLVNYHKGNFHNDGSRFYDIKTFNNKVKLNDFIKELKNSGFIEK